MDTTETIGEVAQRAAENARTLGDGPDHPAFLTDYLDDMNAVDAAFADDAEALWSALDGTAGLELRDALAAYAVAVASGGPDAVALEARTVSGLLLSLVRQAGGGALKVNADEAWAAARAAMRRRVLPARRPQSLFEQLGEILRPEGVSA